MTAARIPAPRAEPAYFFADERACLRWLHRPASSMPVRDTGVVICNPFGYEAICAHRSLRHLAEECVAAGFPALRFDYDGTGDSAGDDLDAGRWTAWSTSVRAAVRELRAQTGVTRVVLLGVRLGASIAACASVDDADVAGVALIAPIAKGRVWLRELRALQATMGRRTGPPEFALDGDIQESVGLLISPETKRALESIDLEALGDGLPHELLVIDRDDRPPAGAIVAQWRGRGHTVHHAVLPDFTAMMSDPHESVVPSAMIASVVHWLESTFPTVQSGAVRTTDNRMQSACRCARHRTVAVGSDVEESVHLFDEQQRLFGVVTCRAGTRPTRAVVLLNSGANHHIGIGRMYVKLARRLAAAGWLVLRYDVSGIGDSLAHDGAPENQVYTPHAVADLGAALEFLRREYAPEKIEAMGLCAGAYHALKGAVANLPIDGITVVNPLVFFWKPGTSLAYPSFKVTHATAQYRRSLLQADKWLKLVRGGVDLQEFTKILSTHVRNRARHTVREIGRAIRVQVDDDLAAELSAITARGARLRFVFSANDPGEALLRREAGRTLSRLEARGDVSVMHLQDCDHSLGAAWMHEALWAQLSQALDPR